MIMKPCARKLVAVTLIATFGDRGPRWLAISNLLLRGGRREKLADKAAVPARVVADVECELGADRWDSEVRGVEGVPVNKEYLFRVVETDKAILGAVIPLDKLALLGRENLGVVGVLR